MDLKQTVRYKSSSMPPHLFPNVPKLTGVKGTEAGGQTLRRQSARKRVSKALLSANDHLISPSYTFQMLV